jgi:hypothetical protein
MLWLLLACAPTRVPYMAPPPELAGSADVWVPSGQSSLGMPEKVGEWTVVEAVCDPSEVRAGSLDAVEWVDRTDPCRIQVQDPAGPLWQSVCTRRVAQSGRRIGGEALIAENYSDVLNCVLVAPNDRWFFKVEGGFREGWTGQLKRSAGAPIMVTTIRTLSGQADISTQLTGVVFSADQPRAALDLVKAGVYWLDPQLPADQVGPTLVSGLSLLLYAGREALSRDMEQR